MTKSGVCLVCKEKRRLIGKSKCSICYRKKKKCIGCGKPCTKLRCRECHHKNMREVKVMPSEQEEDGGIYSEGFENGAEWKKKKFLKLLGKLKEVFRNIDGCSYYNCKKCGYEFILEAEGSYRNGLCTSCVIDEIKEKLK